MHSVPTLNTHHSSKASGDTLDVNNAFEPSSCTVCYAMCCSLLTYSHPNKFAELVVMRKDPSIMILWFPPNGRLKRFGLLYPEGSNRTTRCTLSTFATVPLQSRRRLLCISWPFRPKVQRAEKVNDKKGERESRRRRDIYQSRRNCGKPEPNFAVGPPLNRFEPRSRLPH